MTTLSRRLSSETPSGPKYVVPVDDEPLHQERWKNDLVRIVDVQFPPHTTSLWHQHVHYGVYICVTQVRATEQGIHDEAPRQLYKQRGDVFCRDHTLDRLVHVVSTDELPMRIIEVEILKDDPNENFDVHGLPVHEHRTISIVHQDNKCRVYRLTMLPSANAITLCLPSRAMLVSLDSVAVYIDNTSTGNHISENPSTPCLSAGVRKLQAGDDVILQPGEMTLRVDDWSSASVASFVLCEVY
ncbi:hypothetical protein P43SY_005268 [Pythium insidiosum]|uniref:Uncharacterized protein n=1 Tax=Pythium insidiosum TaxID=114742 RepID=A0AAD5Q6B0_PYTIN|nr:hypothetical protein P43SY_005268 [Pythium insidiosum]